MDLNHMAAQMKEVVFVVAPFHSIAISYGTDVAKGTRNRVKTDSKTLTAPWPSHHL